MALRERKLMEHRAAGASVILVLALLIAGCGRGISQRNYDKIKDGMTQQQVEAILGPATIQSSDTSSAPGMPVGAPSGTPASASVLTWQEGSYAIFVIFDNGKVIGKCQANFK